MAGKHKSITPQSDVAVQIPVYEIRIRGRLEGDYWARWFEGMTVSSTEDGDTLLSGPVLDQAALYGLLARLRDLAVPLVSVRAVEMEEPRRTKRQRRRLNLKINWRLLVLYLLLVGGLAPLTVFLTSEGLLDTALALTLLFAALGGIAYAFALLDRGWGWRLLTVTGGLAAALSLFIYLMVSGWLHPALGVAALFFLAAGGVTVLYGRRARLARSTHEGGQEEPGRIAEQVGMDTAEADARERDRATD
jgi:hypothetical protein